MRSWFTSLLAAVVLLAAPAFAEGHGPALWRISGVGTTLYIFGSVHALKPGTSWLDDDLRQKISSATAIYLEVSPAEEQPLFVAGLVLRYGMLAKGDSLKNHLPAEIYAEVGAAFRAHGMQESLWSLQAVDRGCGLRFHEIPRCRLQAGRRRRSDDNRPRQGQGHPYRGVGDGGVPDFPTRVPDGSGGDADAEGGSGGKGSVADRLRPSDQLMEQRRRRRSRRLFRRCHQG